MLFQPVEHKKFAGNMRYFIINTKNYLEASGAKLDRLAAIADDMSKQGKRSGIEILLAVPSFYVGYLSKRFPSLKILAQHLDDVGIGSTTGFLVPEIASSSGAAGSLVNHSEHRIKKRIIGNLVQKLRELRMISVVCARDATEVRNLAKFNPDFIAIEPPELIGSGRAVSNTRPKVIIDSKSALGKAKPKGSRTKLLCGAGIVERLDAKRAIELGAEGILVASGVVKARQLRPKIIELIAGLQDAK